MSDANVPGGHDKKTLFLARQNDPRERAAQPIERGRAGATRAERTSDVTRFRGVLLAAIVGGSTSLGLAILTPPGGDHDSPGPLARPHVRAKLACAACHATPTDATSTRADVPSTACERCHGQHTSTRPGHERATRAGAMRCSTCHTIHARDQGVTFDPTEPGEPIAVRWAPGVEAELRGTSFHPPRVTTVAIPTVASCTGCHDPAREGDPLARCLIPAQASLGDARPVVCFDEHQRAFGTEGQRNPSPPPKGVCAAQHTEDRVEAWEAAREAAVKMPVVERRVTSGGPELWLGSGLVAATLAFGGAQAVAKLGDRRRKKRALAKAPELAAKPQTRVRLPQIDVSTCLGCYACVDACPYDVLAIERYVAVVARPEACCGLTLCEQRCPNGSLKITDGAVIGDRPRLKDSLESLDTPGLYLAGDVTGVPLIKNAIHQGAHAAAEVKGSLARSKAPPAGVFDLLIVGAGPAGISAALRAKELGLTFEVIEQGGVAQSIASFPRGKLVFDQPLELPVTGKLWLKESSKEELLANWMRIVRQEKLPITEGTRMVELTREADGTFALLSEPREGGSRSLRRAARVIFAIGQRGTPRRLGFEIPTELEARVHYHLADARSFEGKSVLVVGLGDVAMETAIALGRQPSTRVALVHRGDGFHRGNARNIAEVKRMQTAGRIDLRLASEVVGLEADTAQVRSPAGVARLPYDAVFVLIGSIPPWSTLRAAGVKTAGDVDPSPPQAVEPRPA